MTPSAKRLKYSLDERWWKPRAFRSAVARMPSRIPIASMARCTTRLLMAWRSGGTLATRSAMASTSSSSRSAGKARLAKPASTDSAPLIESPVSIASMARRKPSSHGCQAMSGDDIRRTGG